MTMLDAQFLSLGGMALVATYGIWRVQLAPYIARRRGSANVHA